MIRNDDSYNLLARPVALEHQNPAIIDYRDIEALAPSAYIDANPYSHASSMPHPSAVTTLAERGGHDRSKFALDSPCFTAERNGAEAWALYSRRKRVRC